MPREQEQEKVEGLAVEGVEEAQRAANLTNKVHLNVIDQQKHQPMADQLQVVEEMAETHPMMKIQRWWVNQSYHGLLINHQIGPNI